MFAYELVELRFEISLRSGDHTKQKSLFCNKLSTAFESTSYLRDFIDQNVDPELAVSYLRVTI